MDLQNRKTVLSTLWLFILLNIIFRDIHQYALKSHLEMLLTGFYNGTEVTDWLMLMGGFIVEIPILMVLLSRILKRKFNRPVNLVACVLTVGVFLAELPSDMDDVFFKVIQFAALGVIAWIAWKWKGEEKQQ